VSWADKGGEGLMFVAFGQSLDVFEAQLRRMAGQEDGILDGLFRFSHPVSGSYFWCRRSRTASSTFPFWKFDLIYPPIPLGPGPECWYSEDGRLAVDGTLAKPVRSGRKQP